MINLIPTEEKKILAKDFYLRLVALFFIVLAVSVLIASAALLPSYFIASIKENLANTKLDLQKREPVPSIDKETLSMIGLLNNKLGLIEKAQVNKFIVTERIINEINLKKMPDIKITEILYENDPLIGKKISINGIAPSRERLLLFRRALEDDTFFKKVDLPISNFVKGSNITFYLSLIPSTK